MKKIFNLLALLICLLLLASCQTTPKTIGKRKSVKNSVGNGIRECICPQLWLPVCGDNGKTYSNTCFAKCSNVNFTSGPCDQKNLE